MVDNLKSLGLGVGIPALNQFAQKTFNKIDSNEDGGIDKTEWNAMTGAGKGISQKRDALFKMIDTDKNGIIDKTEHENALKTAQKRIDAFAQATKFEASVTLGLLGANEEEANSAADELGQTAEQAGKDYFSQLDKDSDGKVSRDEFLSARESLIQKVRDKAEELFTKFDKNKDGFMDRIEAGYKDTQAAVDQVETPVLSAVTADGKIDFAAIYKQAMQRFSQLSSNFTSASLSSTSYNSSGQVDGLSLLS